MLAYPALVYLGLRHLEGRAASVALAGLALGLLALRLPGASKRALLGLLPAPLSILALVALGALLDDPRWVLAWPALVNLALLLAFGLSLRSERSMVERFARLQDPLLTPEKVRYCRSVTGAWCVFFSLNGGLALALAWASSAAIWALYTGVISYALMAGLFTLEYLLRKRRFRDYGSGLHDRILSGLWPPPPAAPLERPR